MTKWQWYPVLMGAVLGAVVLPLMHLADVYAFFLLSSQRASGVLVCPPLLGIIIPTACDHGPLGLMLGALSGSTWAAWKARDERRLRRNTRWSGVGALVTVVWSSFWPLYQMISDGATAKFMDRYYLGPELVPWPLRFAFLSTASNPLLLWVLFLVLFGWTVIPRLKR